METVASPPDPNALELRLLTDWGAEPARSRTAAIASVVIHVLGLIALSAVPASFLAPSAHHTEVARTVTPLVAPLSEPTQTEPNKGPLSKEFDAEALRPRPRVQIPPSPPSTSRPPALRASLPSPPPAPPPPAMAEPPKLEASVRQAPDAVIPPPPQIQPQEQPKLAFETPAAASSPTPGRGRGAVTAPSNTIQEAIRTLSRGGAGGGLVVGDIGGPPSLGGIGEGMNLPPSPGRQASNLELLSDPMGVDFRPYLIKVLSAVRRNWFAVMPESAKLGRQGRVNIQFAISRNGSVPKLVITGHSGTDALDRAAVAGISASNPFPPLPAEFRGEQVRLQLNFAYNIPRN